MYNMRCAFVGFLMFVGRPVACMHVKTDQYFNHPTLPPTHPSDPHPNPSKKRQGCVTTGEQVLRLYAMDQYSIGQCALAMAGITAAFTALGYVVLK